VIGKPSQIVLMNSRCQVGFMEFILFFVTQTHMTSLIMRVKWRGFTLCWFFIERTCLWLFWWSWCITFQQFSDSKIWHCSLHPLIYFEFINLYLKLKILNFPPAPSTSFWWEEMIVVPSLNKTRLLLKFMCYFHNALSISSGGNDFSVGQYTKNWIQSKFVQCRINSRRFWFD
jgi:hypothetical protein